MQRSIILVAATVALSCQTSEAGDKGNDGEAIAELKAQVVALASRVGELSSELRSAQAKIEEQGRTIAALQRDESRSVTTEMLENAVADLPSRTVVDEAANRAATAAKNAEDMAKVLRVGT